MEGKLIKVENHFILVNDTEIKEDDYYYTERFDLGILQNSGDSKIDYLNNKNSYLKITHATWSIDTFSNIGRLSLKNCEAIENGYDLDVLAKVNYDCDPYIAEYLEHEFKKGFQKALEILGDKKFSEEDVISMIEKSRETGLTAEYLVLTKQQTEWDVEIEMVFNHIPKHDGIHNSHVIGKVPKLDSEGCLILRRK